MQLTVIGPPYTGGVFVSPVPSLWDLPQSSVCLQGKARNPKSAPILNIKLDVHTYGHILTPFVCLRPGRVHIQSTVTSPGQQKKTSSSSSCWLCQQSLWSSVCWNCITWHGDTAVGRKCVCVCLTTLIKLIIVTPGCRTHQPPVLPTDYSFSLPSLGLLQTSHFPGFISTHFFWRLFKPFDSLKSTVCTWKLFEAEGGYHWLWVFLKYKDPSLVGSLLGSQDLQGLGEAAS